MDELTTVDGSELWRKYIQTRDPKVREQIVLQYAPLVKYVLGRMALVLPTVLEPDDVLSYGIVGLMMAVDRYDPSRGVKFETYAISRIRGAIIDALRGLDVVPRSVRQRAKMLERAFSELEQSLGRPPRDEELAEALGVNLDTLNHMVGEMNYVTLSLDSPLGHDPDDDELTLLDTTRDQGSVDPLEDLEREEVVEALARAIEALNERERLVVTLYYYEGFTLKEIAEVLGVSESRVSQLHARAVLRLRSKMHRFVPQRAYMGRRSR
jgi:RNA polymerase sigma factor for flagellar operon FliA